MTIQEAIKLLEEMKENCKAMPFEYRDEKATLKAEAIDTVLAELKESKKEGKWKPKDGDKIWYRDCLGGFVYYPFKEYDQYNEWLINNIPIFPTKEECEKYWHFMDTVKEKSYEFSREQWERADVYKYMIAYGFDSKNFYVDSVLNKKYFGEVYFKDKESAQYIISNFAEELLKYWL